MFSSFGGPDSLSYGDNWSKEAHGLILAALDSHTIAISRPEQAQLILVKSFIVILMRVVDKYWKETDPDSKE